MRGCLLLIILPQDNAQEVVLFDALASSSVLDDTELRFKGVKCISVVELGLKPWQKRHE